MVDANVIEATTLGIAPSQSLAVLIVIIIGSNAAADSPLSTGRTVQILSKDTQLQGLKGGSLTGEVALRGGPGQARFWLIDVTGTTPAR